MVRPRATGPGPDGELAVTVLDSVRRLVAELNPGRAPIPVHLDSSLSRDLALDSLALVELRERLERSCGVRLSDRALAEVDTPREWVHAVMAAVGAAPSPPGSPQVTEGLARAVGTAPVGEPPAGAETLGDALSWHCVARPEAVQVCLLDHSGAAEQQTELTYAALHRQARAVAHGLVGREVEPGQTVGIMLPTGVAFSVAAAAGVPVVPVGIRGTRDVLRPGHRFPRHGHVAVVFGPPLRPSARDWPAVLRLRDAARQAVLARQRGTPGAVTRAGRSFP